MDLGGWLRSLGLEQYEAAFRENEINERVLPSLTQEDLKEIGVGPVGHRRLLLEAIAALRDETAAAKPPPADGATKSTAPSVSPEDRAERRQVTVMFSDLVGSTALSARMDPEDLREVISAYQKSVVASVQRFGGFVAKYMGDGVLIYFGYPQAHEDDAERAVRAVGARKNSNCCCGAGRRQRPVKAKWCCSPARPVSANRGSPQQLLERLASEPHTRLRYFCSPQHTDSAFYPIIGQMERAAGLAHDDTPKARLDKLDALLAQASTNKQDATLFAEMLSLPNDGRYPALDLVPQQRRQKTLEALTAQLAGLASQHPVLDDFRGCALDRSNEPRGSRPDRGPDQNPSGAPHRNFPSRVQCAVGGPAACDDPDAQPAWGT